MTIRKGEPWELPVRPGDLAAPEAADDAELASLVAEAHDPDGGPTFEPPVVRVATGDLSRTLGLSPAGRADPHRFSMDLGLVSIDGGPELPFVAHVVARRSGWLGDGAVIMNAAWVGDLYLGPRAHPNDGLLDITWGRLPPRQLPQARQRARSGSHLPHPDLQTQRAATWEHEWSRPLPIRIDGRRCESGRRLAVRVLPDAFVVVG